jgi:hypothetical protein
MSQRNPQGPLWPSYADLMTSLFCVMLVLFVISYVQLTSLLDRYRISAAKWEKVKEVEESVSKLADEKYFVYQKEFKRHVFREEVRFDPMKATIAPEYEPFLKRAGERIVQLVDELKRKSTGDIKYLIIIEGMASRDKYSNNFELSYQRAYALFKLWQKLGITFDRSVCEVIIAGSGTEGVGRAVEETRNQRFLIQIMPKVGEGWGPASPQATVASF